MRLEVHRSGNAVYTEVLESIDQRTQQMAQDLSVIKRESEIERLDREWQMRRETLLVRGKDGQVSEPGAVGAIIGSIIAIVFGVIWMVGAASAGAPGGFVLFGLVFIGVALFGAISSVGKASQYSDAERAYRQRRAQLLQSDQATDA